MKHGAVPIYRQANVIRTHRIRMEQARPMTERERAVEAVESEEARCLYYCLELEPCGMGIGCLASMLDGAPVGKYGHNRVRRAMGVLAERGLAREIGLDRWAVKA